MISFLLIFSGCEFRVESTVLGQLFVYCCSAMIHDLMNEGKLVASDVIVRLIVKAIQETDNDKFLLDGFPRNEDNLKAFENLTKIEPDFVLYLDCPEEEMIKRVLSRNQGREDDNIETIRKRFRVFEESTLPLVDYYASKGKLRRVDAARSVEEVFESVRAIFSSTELFYGAFADRSELKFHAEFLPS
ncbi:OLC1v1031473C1 [Oldenlandia corymbosa var. corymbosa]|uniref:adenylate kinase n=1 Tax=Oldenlandia corymbosa var. corymbosa TaxID=529605 RepID=A0AAV1CIX4_OLDCO|nr:OLC1v1031473C1 [Oldenlandia corymbosa var. corymbosa]